jgi:hypothetical protein
MKQKQLIHINEEIKNKFKAIVYSKGKMISPVIEMLMIKYIEEQTAIEENLKKVREQGNVFVDDEGKPIEGNFPDGYF